MKWSAGGGAGFQSRLYGLAADRVHEMRVLLANESVVTVNAGSHPDLFWALRGGGSGSFGIILSFTLNVFKLPALTTVVQLDFNLDANVIDSWQRHFLSVCNVMP
jgi:FAD/FMN-containing dehydrogenase